MSSIQNSIIYPKRSKINTTMLKDFFKIKSILSLLKLTVCIISLVINIIFLIILFTPMTEYLHRLIMVDMEPVKGDVIIICSSNFPFETAEGTPGLSTLLRIEKGVRLYKAGYAPKIIAFGGIWMKKARKTTAQAIKERLLLYGIPEEDILVQDDVPGKLHYYENLLYMMEKHSDRFDFNRAMFVTSADQSYRLYHALLSEIKSPIIICCDHYEFTRDWGRRLHIFRRVANELLFGIPYFYFSGRFSTDKDFKWDRKLINATPDTEELYDIILNRGKGE